MNSIFQELTEMDDVLGVIFLSKDEEILFKDEKKDEIKDVSKVIKLVNGIEDLKEMDIVYGKKRVYIRGAGLGYILVVMDRFSNSSMIKLNCDILIPKLRKEKLKKKMVMAQFKDLKI